LWNTERRIQGHSDSPLTERGREQGRRAAERLSGLKIAAVYASDLGRARETGEMIAAPHGLDVRTTPDLRERCYGEFEEKTGQEIRESRPGVLEKWLADRLRAAPPGGETQPEMSDRVMRAIREIAGGHLGETVAVAGHGGPIKSAFFAVLDIPLDSWDRTWIANGSVTVLRGTPDELRVASFNDTSHVDQAQVERRYV
jgi:broad specificity phosphatase PhoE